MKKVIINIICFSFALLYFTACKKDNMEGPNAKFFGGIKDSINGTLVETELINGSVLEAYEQGYASPVVQTWVVKNTGEFRNNLVFANTYNFKLRNGNFFAYDVNGVNIKPGDNLYDFYVVPYIRISNSKITYDAASNKINATFNVEAGKSQVKLKAIRLYAFSDIYVGESVKFTTSGTSFSQTFTPSKTIDATTYSLSIDLTANASVFPKGRDYFFRVGALAEVPGVGTVRHNYTPNVKISL